MGGDETVEDDRDDEDSTIIAEEEEGDEDVTDIVGDVRGDKETRERSLTLRPAFPAQLR